MKKKIQEETAKLFDWLVETRRDLHMHPETGLQEIRTSAKAAEELQKLGLEVKTGIATTGVVGLLHGGSPGRTIAIRADMDALPVREETGLPFASKNNGVMHACGHDAHVAMALGTARVLAGMREQIHGNVKFIMQPAEENLGGARDMIVEGAMEDPKVDAIISIHVETHASVGTLTIKSGPIWASADAFVVSINGKGGHGSQPHDSVDPIHIAAHVIVAIQTMIPRMLDARDPVVVSVCSIQGGTAFNIIPESVTLSGTVRTLSQERRAVMPAKLEDIVRGVTATFGGTYDFTYVPAVPVTSNDPGMTEIMRGVAEDLWGAENVLDMERPNMGSEDYSYYVKEVPGVMGRLGAAKAGAERYPAHHPKFDIDERCLPFGVELLSATAIKFLNGNV